MTTIVIDGLSAKSLKDAAKRIDRYRNQFVQKNREFIRELCRAGIQVMYGHLGGDIGDSDPPQPNDNPRVYMGVHEGVMTAILSIEGEDVMFVEFGAGISKNGPPGQSPNKLGNKLGYVIGSYGLGQGKNEYWYYKEDGEWHKSYGTQATMPMYSADRHIRDNFASIAKRVFGG